MNTSIENVNGALTDLCREKIIELDGNDLSIRDNNLLLQISEKK